VIELKERVFFLNKIHLFNGLNDEQLAGIAVKLEERTLGSGTVVFERGGEADGFFMIYRGRVQVTRPRRTGQDFLAWLVAGDYFGEEALFAKRARSATVRVVEESLLFFLPRKEFDELIKKFPTVKPKFLVAIKSRRLARRTHFKWLEPGEVIYFIARRHPIRLVQAMVGPVFSLSVPIFLLSWSFLTGATTPALAGILVLIGVILWGIWNAIDWSNDFYIVTNRRVIWLEKVIGLYDSRQEAPLSTILSVGMETDMLGRALDYGIVVVRTFVGKIQFDYVNYPLQAAGMIREHWERTKEGGVQAQKDAMKNAIRQKLGMTVQMKVEDEPEKIKEPVESLGTHPQKPSLLRIVLSNLFKLRVEDSGTITYRKHWFVLLRQTWKPFVVMVALIGLIISRLWSLYRSPVDALFEQAATPGRFFPDGLMAILLFLLFLAVGWLVWEYVDWKNDIFQITPDEIFDIDRKPFGTEERRAAQLENILSTEYKRIGLAGYVFNFGTVYITVGGSQLAFEDVLDPAGVQADIDRRRMARLGKKREEAAAVDRERMASWIAAYHLNRDEFDEEFNASPEDTDLKEGGDDGISG
jgi:hypothetical protein